MSTAPSNAPWRGGCRRGVEIGSTESFPVDSHRSWVEFSSCRYYCDIDKLYPFSTNRQGAELLEGLMTLTEELLALNQSLMEHACISSSPGNRDQTVDDVKREGYHLYRNKSSLASDGVTWTDEEYSSPGMAHWYIRLKSLQRFTETWAMLERSLAMGVFDGIPEKQTVRLVSLGGGPGFELQAARMFFATHPLLRGRGVDLELISMDKCVAWEPYNEKLGLKFVPWDICSSTVSIWEALGLSPGSIDYILISNVMIYLPLSSIHTFHDLLTKGAVRAILTNERKSNWTRELTPMEQMGSKVARLIKRQPDDRQLVLCSSEFFGGLRPDAHVDESEVVFPNVPYEDHKVARGRAGVGGGVGRGGSGGSYSAAGWGGGRGRGEGQDRWGSREGYSQSQGQGQPNRRDQGSNASRW